MEKFLSGLFMFIISMILRIDSTHTGALMERGELKLDLKEYKEALEDFKKVIRIDAKHTNAHYKAGHAYYNIGDSDGACMEWKIARDLGFVDGFNMIESNCK